MIIVKTSNGDVFVNEKAIAALCHEKKEKKVKIYDNERELAYAIDDVEGIVYASDTQPLKWVDE